MTNESMRVEGPVLTPPAVHREDSVTDSSGASAPSDQVQDPGLSAADTDSAPTLAPPGAEVATEDTTGVTATWHSSVKIDALWGIDETRNAWIRVVGVGWKKIHNGRDGAFQALVTLAGQARQTGRPVNLREEAGGIIHEIYLW